MAIDVKNPDHKQRLSRAMQRSFSDNEPTRRIRKNLMDIYRDESNHAYEQMATDSQDLGTLLNHFQKFVRGHMLTLAYYSPKWDVEARGTTGRGFDKRIKSFLGGYSEILNFNRLQRQLALDSAFGWAVCKVDNGIAPKGITAPVAPRAYRIPPDMLITDKSAPTVEECSFIGDMYLVPLNEAQAHEAFDAEGRSKLAEFRDSSSSAASYSLDGTSDTDRYAEPMTRLVDVYIPKAGKIYTWPAPDDEFNYIASMEPIGERVSAVNPYVLLSLLEMPGHLIELARLRSLRGLHLVSNEMLHKGIEQARASQRNPVGPLGSEQDMTTAMNAGDNNPIFMEDKDKLGLYQIPGPDQSILGLGMNTSKMFSSEAGNLEVALGASAGAETARQTEALLGQISASQSLDRRAFEEFLAEIGKKLVNLAFDNEELEVETLERIPGTKISYSRLWAGPTKLPRMGTVDSFNFAVTPYSTAFRTPQEKVAQLNQASQLVQQWFMAKQQGAPIAIEQVITDISDGFDLLPNLQEWWNGQDPTPQERTANTYTSMAQGPEGSDVRYQGSDKDKADELVQPAPEGGIS